MPIARSRRALPALVLVLLLAAAQPLLPSGSAAAQNDGGSGGDAGGSLATATRVVPAGLYAGTLAGGADADDYYVFHVPLGGSINIEVRGGLQTGTLLAGDLAQRLGFRLLGPGGVLIDSPVTNQADSRVTLLAAPAAGDYYFQVTSSGYTGAYEFCFLPVNVACPVIGHRPIQIIGSSLAHTDVHVLLIPPAHGDLGNPFGPTALDYLDAALSGIHAWERAIDAFATDYPQYAYLREITIEVEVFDGVNPVDPAGFDFIAAFVESSGPLFRGVAGSTVDLQGLLNRHDLPAHFSGRYFVLSLHAASPRAGQLMPDYPEYNDLEAVTKHEFAHVFGLGHTQTWTLEHGPDLMNSPAPFVYGDGNPVGDGGERTEAKCINSLHLYALAYLYRWIPSGQPVQSGGWITSPLPYEMYC